MKFSQIFYSHLENDVYVDIYPDRCATEMFGKDNIYAIVVTECDEDEESKYWAWLKYKSKRPYRYIWHDRDLTIRCIKNWEQKEREGLGKLVNVKIREWEY